jgi:hypothetical protein
MEKKVMQGKGKELVKACQDKRWEDARAIIAGNPLLVCTARNEIGWTLAWRACAFDKVDFLQYIFDTILSLERRQEKQQQMLKDAFEIGTSWGSTPAHISAERGYVNCLVFLMDHSPNGAAVLQGKDMYGYTPFWEAAYDGCVDALDFIVRNAPSRNEPQSFLSSSGLQIPGCSSSGVEVEMLKTKDNRGVGLFDRIVEWGDEQTVQYITNLELQTLPRKATFKSFGCTNVQNHP